MNADSIFETLDAHAGGAVMVGLLKPSGYAETVHFSLSGCTNWVAIPTDAIANFRPLALAPCGDHEHHVVRLFLKRPDSGHGGAFADLLKAQQAVGQASTAPGGDNANCPGGYFDFSTGRWVCP